jgi:hypothetical protein
VSTAYITTFHPRRRPPPRGPINPFRNRPKQERILIVKMLLGISLPILLVVFMAAACTSNPTPTSEVSAVSVEIARAAVRVGLSVTLQERGVSPEDTAAILAELRAIADAALAGQEIRAVLSQADVWQPLRAKLIHSLGTVIAGAKVKGVQLFDESSAEVMAGSLVDTFATSIRRSVRDSALSSTHDWVLFEMSNGYGDYGYWDNRDRLSYETWLESEEAPSRPGPSTAAHIFDLYTTCTNAHLNSAAAGRIGPDGDAIRATCAEYDRSIVEYQSVNGEADRDTSQLRALLNTDAAHRGDLSEFRAALRTFKWLSADVREHLDADARRATR